MKRRRETDRQTEKEELAREREIGVEQKRNR